MKNDIEILERNFQIQKPSFVFSLHEEETFDEKLFWEYINSINELIYKSQSLEKLDRRIVREIFLKYDLVFRRLNDTKTQRLIINLDPQKIDSFVDRLYTAIDGYFQGYVLDESLFDDGLVNPFYTK